MSSIYRGEEQYDFTTALLNLAVSAEWQYMRSGMTLILEPDLYERFTFTLKQTLRSELHQGLDSGTFTFNTPVGRMLITRGSENEAK